MWAFAAVAMARQSQMRMSSSHVEARVDAQMLLEAACHSNWQAHLTSLAALNCCPARACTSKMITRAPSSRDRPAFLPSSPRLGHRSGLQDRS